MSCPICSRPEKEYWGSESGYEAVRCSVCGLVYIYPWPDLSERSVELKYGQHSEARDTSKRRPGAVREYSKILKSIYGDVPKSKWLDIGCGFGEFVETVKALAPGSTVIGSEPNLEKQKVAKERGLDVGFHQLEDMADNFTHISLLNVFSHLPDPVGFLSLARERLQNGGEILIQTGNGGDVKRNEFPGVLNFPDHLMFASRQSLSLALSKAGLSIISIHAYRSPRPTPLNISKDIAKRILRKGHNPAKWFGPYRSLWVRAN